MLDILKAFVLGVVQGVTEFLPISSTGHLILFESLFGISQEKYGLTFDAALHLGTLIAIVWFFRRDFSQFLTSILRIIKVRQIQMMNEKIVALLFIGTIPAVLLGLLFEDVIDTVFRSSLLVGVSLILFSGVLWYVERLTNRNKNIEHLTYFDGFIIGIAQSIALIPGVSRSGMTIAAGMQRYLKRDEAARFAFLLSAPIVAGAGGKKIIDATSLFFKGTFTPFDLTFFAVGILSSTIFGYLTIKYFLRYLSHNTLYPFVIYRVIVGFIVIYSRFR